MTEILFLLVAVALVAVCGIFVAAEFAFVTVDRTRIERLAKQGDVRAKGVVRALQSLSTQLSGAQIGITVTNLAVGFLAEPAVASLIHEPLKQIGVPESFVTTLAFVIAISVATIFTMVFGELVPKNLAIARPIETAKAVQGFQRRFSALMHYPILFTNGTANRIVRRFNIEPQEELASARSVEELMAVVRHSAQRGTLAKDTALLLERSLEFGDRQASDVMTPRVRLKVVNASDSVQEIIHAVKRTGFSRFPVIDTDIDHVVGMVHVKHAVAVPYDQRTTTKISAIMHPITFMPTSIELDVLIEKMRADAIESVITIDEFGGVDGLVTLEDLIEELVGEVKDEHDEHGTAIVQTSSGVWSVSGLLRVDEVSVVTELVLPDDEAFETIGGLVMDRLEEVPEVGDVITVTALNSKTEQVVVRLKVTKMDGRRIDRIELAYDAKEVVA